MKIAKTLVALTALTAITAPRGAAQDKPPEKPVKVVADLGFVNASGNSEVTTLNVGEKLTWKPAGSRFSFGQVAKYVYGKTDGEKSADQVVVEGRVDYAISSRLSAFGGLNYDRDPFAGIDKRFMEPVGLSFLAVDAAKHKLTLEGGAAFTQVTYTELQANDQLGDELVSVRAAATYKWLFAEKAYFQEFAEYLPALETDGGYRFNSETAVVAPIAGIFALKAAYLIRYNSAPPVGFGDTDRTFTTGIQITP
jgi:putative salt-induced outer membrane protein